MEIDSFRPRKCCVPNCSDLHSKRHRFPKPELEPELFEMWLEKINNPFLKNKTKEQIHKSHFVCHAHFEDEFKVVSHRGLSKVAYPTLFLAAARSMESEDIDYSSGDAVQVSANKPINSVEYTWREIIHPLAEMPEPVQHDTDSVEEETLISTEQGLMHSQSISSPFPSMTLLNQLFGSHYHHRSNHAFQWRIPEDRYSEWLKAIRRPSDTLPHSSRRICSEHFTLDSFIPLRGRLRTLKAHAIPILKLTPPQLLMRIKPIMLESQPSTSQRNLDEVEELSSVRHDSWMRALGRDPTIEHLSHKNNVCSVHFLEEDKFLVNNKLKLRPNAVPRLHLRKSSVRAPINQKSVRTTISDPNEAIPKHKILRTSAWPSQSTKPSNSRNSLFENAESSIENIEPPPNSMNASQTPSINVVQTVRPLQKVCILPVPSQGASHTLVHLPLIPSDSKKAVTTPVIIIPQAPGATPNNIFVRQVAGMIPQSSISTATAISNSSTDNSSGSSCLIQNVTHTDQSMAQSEHKCRTCLEPVPDLLERTSISMICYEEKSVREGLVQLLPEMKSTLLDDHFVCSECFLLLRDTLRFLKRCLETERVITKDLKNKADDAFEEPEFVTVEDDQESTNPISDNPLNSDDHNYLDECGSDDSISPDEFDHRDEEDDWAFEFDPNVEEQDYILNGITNLLKGCGGTTTSNDPKQSDLNDCEVKHLNFLPLEHAKVSDHDTIVSIRNLEPDFMLSLQQEKIGLLQNCSKFDENIFRNKRVLLLGGVTEIKCLLCEELFNTEAKMQDHMIEVHGLSKAHLMEAHCYQYKPGSSNTCEACGRKCLTSASKKNHLNICHVFPCPYCDELFDAAMLRNHTKEVHYDSRPFKCFRCKQEMSSYTGYQSHSCSLLICETCGADFVDKNSFRHHSIRCKKIEDNRKRCPECRERFSVSEYINHVKIHQFPCTICGKIFHSRNAVGKHEHYHHSQKNETLCPICGKLVNILSQHLATHHENKLKNVKCSLCPKSYFHKSHLSRHVKLHHMFTRIVCERCGKYCNEHNIENHYGSEHPDETEFNCAECEATFTRIAFLKQHAKSHADETRNRKRRNNYYKNNSNNPRRPRSDETFVRKYKFRIKEPDAPITCKHCLKTVKGLAHYRRHLETHMPLLRYKCRYCDITYSCYSNRMRHEKLHKDPKYKFRCGECWKIMDNQDELDAHMAGHAARPKKYQCGECSQLFCREYQLRSHLINDHVREEDLKEARDEILKDALMEFAV